mmetsp:Transcript_11597/g.11234  ORF Transcript_11597/g.11234 Transcript_11597/m.11234 type:complete len:284 (+) Transcript_11597:30-881(+)
MAAISMNFALKGLCERALLIPCLFKDESELQSLKDDILSGFVSKESLHILSKALKEMPEEKSLHSYITGSKVVFPTFQTKSVETSNALKKRREYLHLRKEAKEYNMMIYGTEDNPNVQDILTTGNQFASMTNQLTISVNMIVAVFAMFGVGYYVGMQYSDNKTTQMTFGLVSAIGIMVVEMLLFIRRATQMEGAFEKKPSALQEADAQMRSGALLTSLPSNHSNYNGKISEILPSNHSNYNGEISKKVTIPGIEIAVRNDSCIKVEKNGIVRSENDASKKKTN